jgi:N-acetylneuraminate synthase
MGIGVAVAAVALGAQVIEKHFTLSRAEGGVDSAFSLEPNELSGLVSETLRAWQSLGNVRYGPTEAEQKSLVFRRSLFIAKDMKAGDVLTEENVRIVRPGLGLPPKYLNVIIGMKLKQNVVRGSALSWDLLG